MFEIKAAKNRDVSQSKLLFKKRMFRETDENITDQQFVNLSYMQAQYDYLQVCVFLGGDWGLLWVCMGGRGGWGWGWRWCMLAMYGWV